MRCLAYDECDFDRDKECTVCSCVEIIEDPKSRKKMIHLPGTP